MVRKFILSLGFLLLTFATLTFSLLLLQYSYDAKNNFLFTRPNYQMYSALPGNPKLLAENIKSLNVRVETIESFLKTYKSPLLPYAEFMVKVSDKHGLDYRLLPAMAMQESNLCKKAPPNSYNCWGYGIYGGNILTFSGFEEAIEKVAAGLSRDYKEYGLITPKQIMAKYTPSNTGAWALAVEYFMQKLTFF